MAVIVLSFAACAQGQKKTGNQRGPGQGGGMMMANKDADSVFVALKNETLGKFKQLTFEDAETGKTLKYKVTTVDGDQPSSQTAGSGIV